MVLARLLTILAIVCGGEWGSTAFTLQGVRSPYGPLRSPLHPNLQPRDEMGIEDFALMPDSNVLRYEKDQLLNEIAHPHTPEFYRLRQLISDLADEVAAGDSLEGAAEGGALPAEVVEAVEAEGNPLIGEAERGRWEATDPRSMVLNGYVTRFGEASSNRKSRERRNGRTLITNNNTSTNNNNNNNNPNNPNSSDNNSLIGSSSSASTSSIANPSNSANFKNMNSKRRWPQDYSRRRSSGLSLSIDASMKVLREALYLEIARKKQRQQLQRAQHNKAILDNIGKRDVSSQIHYSDKAKSGRN